jgi:putative endonuclease
VHFFDRIRGRLGGGPPHRLPPGSTRAQRGAFGEDLAAEHCRRVLGYRQIVRNWRYRQYEIDLICQDGDVLVFIEVRARAEDASVPGFYSVDRHKKAVLRRACGHYLKQLADPPRHFRFDIIDVSICKEGRGVLRHYPNVALFNKHFSVQRRKP